MCEQHECEGTELEACNEACTHSLPPLWST